MRKVIFLSPEGLCAGLISAGQTAEEISKECAASFNEAVKSPVFKMVLDSSLEPLLTEFIGAALWLSMKDREAIELYSFDHLKEVIVTPEGTEDFEIDFSAFDNSVTVARIPEDTTLYSVVNSIEKAMEKSYVVH